MYFIFYKNIRIYDGGMRIVSIFAYAYKQINENCSYARIIVFFFFISATNVNLTLCDTRYGN